MSDFIKADSSNQIEIIRCLKEAKSASDIMEKFNADDTCMKCPNIVYKDGVISCKYARVN